jgi:hypothetical protein
MGAQRFQDRFRKAMGDVSKVFDRPRELFDDPEFDREQKRTLLKQWEYDLRALQVASEENMAEAEPSKTGDLLQEVRSCLRKLGDHDAPKRSASHKQGG